MTRSKLGLLGLCVMVLGLMAFATSSASAAEWLILNSAGEVKIAAELPTTVTAEFEPKTDVTLLAEFIGLTVNILCKSFFIEKGELIVNGKLKEGAKLAFQECTAPEPIGPKGGLCTVRTVGSAAKTIVTNELKGTLQSNGEMLIEPRTAGGDFAELLFEGAECTLPTGIAEPVNGVLWVKDVEPETHLVKHLVVQSKAKFRENSKKEFKLGTLWIGKDTEEHLETSIDGSALVFLTGVHAGLKWGATLP